MTKACRKSIMSAIAVAWPQAFMIALWSIFLSGNGVLCANGSPTLTPAIVHSCPGERVTFTCIVTTGNQLYWEVDYLNPSLPDIRKQRYLINDEPGLRKSANLFEFILISNSPILISNASTTVQLQLEGARIYCMNENSVRDTSVIHVVQDPISINDVLMISAIPTENNTVVVHIHVSANNIREDHIIYYVSVSPPVDSGTSTFTTKNSTFQLSVLYNHGYTASVVANNCAGNSTPVAITFNISQCMSPMHASNVTIESNNYSIAIEGSQVTYYCKDGLVPSGQRVATCVNGSWNPDPAELMCTGVDQSSSVSNRIPNKLIECGVPTVLKGARILEDSSTTIEGSQITLICNEGLFLNYTITSICTREGTWYPDPAEFSCLPETSGPIHSSNNHSDSGSKCYSMNLPLYVSGGLCSSVVFYILGVVSTITLQWCRQRKRRCKISHDTSPKGTQGGQSEPIYAECITNLPTSSQELEFNSCSNVAYQHPQVKNMYVYF